MSEEVEVDQLWPRDGTLSNRKGERRKGWMQMRIIQRLSDRKLKEFSLLFP